MKHFEDYTSYSKMEAAQLLNEYLHKEDKRLMSPSGDVYTVNMVIIMPAHPLLQNILTQLISAVTLELLPDSIIENLQNGYALDEYIIGALCTATSTYLGTPFEIIALRQVVGPDGELGNDFLGHGWQYLD